MSAHARHGEEGDRQGPRPVSAYDADENLRLALIHLIQIVGEVGRQVSREFSDRHPEIPWADIIGMRHKVVHDYLGVDEDIVWQVVTEDLPKLMATFKVIVLPEPTVTNGS